MILYAWRSDLSPFMRLRDEMNRLFDSSLYGRAIVPGWFERRARYPRLNLAETADTLTVECELPGVDKEDIDISVEGGVLRVRGVRKPPEDRQAERYHRRERGFGEFERSIELPAKVDAANVNARLTDGVLEIVLSKLPESKPKRIEVKGT